MEIKHPPENGNCSCKDCYKPMNPPKNRCCDSCGKLKRKFLGETQIVICSNPLCPCHQVKEEKCDICETHKRHDCPDCTPAAPVCKHESVDCPNCRRGSLCAENDKLAESTPAVKEEECELCKRGMTPNKNHSAAPVKDCSYCANGEAFQDCPKCNPTPLGVHEEWEKCEIKHQNTSPCPKCDEICEDYNQTLDNIQKQKPWSETMTNEQLAIADEMINGKRNRPSQPKESWVKEFDEVILYPDTKGWGIYPTQIIAIKDFIHSLLSRHNLALVEAVSKLRKSKFGDEDKPFYGTSAARSHAHSFNSALDAVIEIINPKV